MIRAILMLVSAVADLIASVIWLAVAIIALLFVISLISRPAHAQDNNPFSGAREIRVVMVRDKSANRVENIQKLYSRHPRPIRKILRRFSS